MQDMMQNNMQDGVIGSATLRVQEELGSSIWEWLGEFKTYAMFCTQVLYPDEPLGPAVDWFVALPLMYNRRDYLMFEDLPQVEDGMVFRALRPEEDTDLGLEPKLPHLHGKVYKEKGIEVRGMSQSISQMTLDKHVQSGSNLSESKYISTSRCPVAAFFYAVKSYACRHREADDLKMAAINLGPMNGIGGVREHAYIYDMSNLALRQAYLKTDKAHNYAQKFEEVLLEGVVPPNAITGCMSLSTICALVKDPQLLERLRVPVCSGFDSFRDACSGVVENAIRRYFSLPILASVQPERALSNMPVLAQQRPIPAKYGQTCRICGQWISKGDAILNTPSRGWVHASCVGGPFAPPRQATRRGGMSARKSARAAAIARDNESRSSDFASIPGTHDSWL